MKWYFETKHYIIQNTGWSHGTSWFSGEVIYYSMKAAKQALKKMTKMEDCLYRIAIEHRQVSKKKIRVTTTFTDVLYGTLWDDEDIGE